MNIPQDNRLSRSEFGDATASETVPGPDTGLDAGPDAELAPLSLMNLLARGAQKHRLLTVIVLFQAMLLVAGTVWIVGTLVYRASAPDAEPDAEIAEPSQ